ncbi:uncharacterized protein LOC115678716 [Syzygium oleosum]|uniref:uncharacterized protein LOC115678716 n=1 Tax=Syzygium oleosum TaxID=219896 RepID=UPI0024BA39C0|nr:uncharacterized protein LOC115678716 [Syzygium oleosum]
MDGRGGCCIARYGGGGGGGGGLYDMSKVDRIMLRFRPIAPKPTCGGSSSGASSPEGKDTRVRAGRGRRRQVRSGSNVAKRSSRKRRVCSKEKVGDASPPGEKVTLPLLPEMPEHKVGGDLGNAKAGLMQAADCYRCAMDPDFFGDTAKRQMQNVPKWLRFDDKTPNPANGGHFGPTITTAAPPLLRPLGRPSPCVTVECVTDTWVDGEALGRTDDERRRNLERDTCPGFTSDGLGRVTWTNAALRKMVGREEEQEEEEGCGVWLAAREEVGVRAERMMWGAFTCRVRMEYACERERRAVTLPCDVWRMDGGGFAWRLDVEAALRLGR